MSRLPAADRDPADDGRGPGPDDIDPTGMRAILSALPDPGPMPADLVDRITASLAAEQAGGSGDSQTPGPDSAAAASRGATVHSLAPAGVRRSRGMRRLPGVAIAASTVVIAGGAVFGLLGMDRGLTMVGGASDTLTSFSDVADEGVADEGVAEGGAAASEAESMSPESATEAQGFVILASGAVLSSDTLRDHAQAVLVASSAPGDAGVADGQADGSTALPGDADGDAERARASSPLRTAQGAADCLSGLLSIAPLEAANLLVAVDFVRFDGAATALVVAHPSRTQGTGAQDAASAAASTAYLVPLDCRRGNAVVLQEPVRLAS